MRTNKTKNYVEELTLFDFISLHHQSLAMYVPPDEPVQELGEVNMTYRADDHSVTADGGASVISVDRTRYSGEINPIYQR